MTTPDIESTTNPRVKAWAALAKRSVRDTTKTFLIEGEREVSRAAEHFSIKELLWCPEYGPRVALDGVQTTSLSARAFDKLSHRQNPDGAIGVANTPNLGFERFSSHDHQLVLVADGVEKPGNVGAMLRSCDAFGAAFVGSSLGTDLVNPNVIRAAQGSLFTTPIASAPREKAIAWCVANTTVIVAEPDGGTSLWNHEFAGPTSIVIGSEHGGVDPAWLSGGVPVVIPMAGVADSLNASVSAGVFLAEAVRQFSG